MSTKAKERLTSLDTYRGITLALLVLEATRWDWVHVAAHAHPESGFWKFVEHHFSHVAWAGAGISSRAMARSAVSSTAAEGARP